MSKLYQCPYEKATKCKQDESCRGCETFSEYSGMTYKERLYQHFLASAIPYLESMSCDSISSHAKRLEILDGYENIMWVINEQTN